MVYLKGGGVNNEKTNWFLQHGGWFWTTVTMLLIVQCYVACSSGHKTCHKQPSEQRQWSTVSSGLNLRQCYGRRHANYVQWPSGLFQRVRVSAVSLCSHEDERRAFPSTYSLAVTTVTQRLIPMGTSQCCLVVFTWGRKACISINL
jgi:hypothetical protein